MPFKETAFSIQKDGKVVSHKDRNLLGNNYPASSKHPGLGRHDAPGVGDCGSTTGITIL